MDRSAAWRTAMLVPPILFRSVAAMMKLKCWDAPTAIFFTIADTGNATKAAMWDYVEVCRDIGVVVMVFQCFACCFAQLAMNARIATFQMNRGDATVLAGCFG